MEIKEFLIVVGIVAGATIPWAIFLAFVLIGITAVPPLESPTLTRIGEITMSASLTILGILIAVIAILLALRATPNINADVKDAYTRLTLGLTAPISGSAILSLLALWYLLFGSLEFFVVLISAFTFLIYLTVMVTLIIVAQLLAR